MIKRDSTIISGQGGLSGAEKPFDAMNNIVANLLLNITRYSITVVRLRQYMWQIKNRIDYPDLVENAL